MSSASTTPAASTPPVERPVAAGSAHLPLILFLFVGSGCSALIYEIVWFQLLEFSVGSSAISIGVLLATFMGGLCLGSLLFHRVIRPRWHPLLVYGCLELGIGILGVLLTMGLPAFESIYAAIGSPSITLRAVLSALFLLPPTMLMGATLPAISRWVGSTPRGMAWLGFFYGGNTLGAVAGCLLAGFYFLRLFDMSTVSCIAAGINFTVAAVGIALSRRAAAPDAAPTASTIRTRSSAGILDLTSIAPPRTLDLSNIHIYITIALSGMAALGAEVIWTRLLSLLLGATTYTFSIILAVFLAGLGIGSSCGAMLTRSARNPRTALAWCQVLCSVSIGWTAYAVTNGVPNWPIDPVIAIDPAYSFALDLARCAWAILPATLFWGASFPFALAAVAGTAPGAPARDSAKSVGRVYAANTIGAILGALFFSLIAVKTWGTQSSEHMLIGIAAVAAVVAALSLLTPLVSAERPALGTFISAQVALLAALCLSGGTIYVLSHYDLDAVPWQLVAYGRNIAYDRREYYDRTLKVMREGQTSSVAVTQARLDEHYFHVAGKVEASTLPEDMRLQLMLGHFPALFHPEPKKALVVGCGAGITAGTFTLDLPRRDADHPDDVKIVICEIEPLVPEVVATYFKKENNDVVTRNPVTGKLLDDRVQIVDDDARHYVLTTDEKFDIITSDPIHPWVKGAACLYTKEYFDIVKKHLKPGGLVTQWVPLYESSPAVVKSEIKTFFDAFPNGTIWSNDMAGAGYDVVLMGGDQPLEIDAFALKKRMEGVLISATLARVHFDSATDILGTYAGQASDLKGWLADGEVNHDSNLRLQYLAGASLNEDKATNILNAILSCRTFPAAFENLTADQRADLERSWSPNSPLVPAPPEPATTAPDSMPNADR